MRKGRQVYQIAGATERKRKSKCLTNDYIKKLLYIKTNGKITTRILAKAYNSTTSLRPAYSYAALATGKHLHLSCIQVMEQTRYAPPPPPLRRARYTIAIYSPLNIPTFSSPYGKKRETIQNNKRTTSNSSHKLSFTLCLPTQNSDVGHTQTLTLSTRGEAETKVKHQKRQSIQADKSFFRLARLCVPRSKSSLLILLQEPSLETR